MVRWCLSLLLTVVQIYSTEAVNYQCAVCPAGKYKTATTNNDCVSCPADTYQDSLGATSATQCKPCPSNSYAPTGSDSATDCLCGLGYSGDVATFLTGSQNENLQRSCGSLLNTPCTTRQSKDQITSANAVDTSMTSQSFAVYPSAGETSLLFTGMMTWWRVAFEREAVVQSLNIYNIDNVKLQSFSIRVGNVEPFSLMGQNTLCASNVQWPAGAPSLVVTCTQAVRGKYLYIINGNQGGVILNNVQVIGYLLPASEVCLACASGKFKASTGTATCTNCDSGTASASTAATSAAVCAGCLVNQYSLTGASACSNCPSNSQSAAGSVSSDYCRCDRGYTTAPSTTSCSLFQTLYQAKRPWAHYSADGWNSASRILADQSGNNRHASSSSQMNTISGPFTTAEAGALNPISFLRGNNAANLQFPQNSIPVNFTICSVTKYASTDASMQARILTSAEDVEWWHGHYNKKRGVAKFASQDIMSMDGATLLVNSVWNTGQTGSNMNLNWTVMCSKNGGITPWNVLVDGQAAGTSTRSDSNPAEWPGLTLEVRTANMEINRAKSMCINCRSPMSAWDLSQVMIWDSSLTDMEMQTVSLELLKYTPLSSVCSVLPGEGCVACPAGKYKSTTGGGTCVDCQAGKYRTDTGAIGENLCTPCPANTFAFAGSTLQTDCMCNAGYAAVANGVACTACLAGSYKTGVGIGTCTNCGANEYSTTVAQVVSTCSSCPLSSQAPAGSNEASDCQCNVGYTGANGAACLSCVQGTYKTSIGPSTCTLCGNNTFSSTVAATSSSVCLPCQGNSISLMGSTRQSDCHCFMGYLTNNLGSGNATCEMCSAGSYNSQLDATTCSKCGAGYKSSTPGAVAVEQCTACAVNTYSAAGAAQCDICPSNTFTSAMSVQLSDCKCLAGYYSAVIGEDGRSCSACQAGKHKALTGASPCIDCPANRYSTATAATSNATCQACTNWAVSPVASSSDSQCLCNFGYSASCISQPGVNVARLAGVTGLASSTGTESSNFPQTNGDWTPNALYNAAHLFNGNLGPRKYDLVGGVGTTVGPGWQAVENLVLGSATNFNWVRLNLGQIRSVEAVVLYWTQLISFYRTSLGWTTDQMMVNLRLQVGNVDSPNANPDCATGISSGLSVNLDGGGERTTPVFLRVTCIGSGQFVYLVQPPGVRQMQLSEMEIYSQGAAPICSCNPCTAGTFKDTIGPAACTNCPANSYSGLTARTSNTTCTPCYDNSVAPAGSVSMDACNCVAGYEFT